MSDLLSGFQGGQPSEEQRQKIREAMLSSTFAFGKFVCGFHDLDPDVHAKMSLWIQRPTRFKLGQAPRGFLKTSTWTIANGLRRATKDPNSRTLISNEIQDNAEKWIGLMQDIVMSPIYRWLFPEVVPDPTRVKWNAHQLELKRTAKWPEATIEGCGVGGASTSNHYSTLINDDLVGKAARESPAVMEKAIDHRKLCWSLMVDASQSEIHDFGTRWAPQDVIDWILKNVSDVDQYFVPIRTNGTPTWPTRYPEEIIKQIRLEQGGEMFALQYENRVVGEGASKFDSALLRKWHLEFDHEEKMVFVLETPQGEKRVKREDCWGFQIIDAGLNPESPDARTANVTAFLTPPTPTVPFDLIIVEAKATKSTPYEVIEESHKSYAKWDPLYASIETFGGHQAFFHWLCVTYQDMRIRELKKDFSRNAKQKRINGFWGSYPSQGRVYILRSHTDLVDELDAYPHGTVDLLDAAGYLPTVWAPPNPQKPGIYRRPGVSDFDLSDYDAQEMIDKVMEGRSDFTGYSWLVPLLALLFTVSTSLV
jgi:hypothetical protein